MNVSGAQTPQVYIPMQALAPAVPNDHPLGLPTPDRNADPTEGTPFVAPEAAQKKGGHATPGALDGSAMLTPSVERPKIVTPKVEAPDVTQQVAQLAKSKAAFDVYA